MFFQACCLAHVLFLEVSGHRCIHSEIYPAVLRAADSNVWLPDVDRHDSYVHAETDKDERTFGDLANNITLRSPAANGAVPFRIVGPAERRLHLFSERRQKMIQERFAEYDADLEAVMYLQKSGGHMATYLQDLLPFTIKHLFGMSYYDGYGGCAEKDTVMKSMGDWQFLGCEQLYLTPERGPWLLKKDSAPMNIGFVAPYMHVVTKEVRLMVILRPTVSLRSKMNPPYLSEHFSYYRSQDLADIGRADDEPVLANNQTGIWVHQGIWSRVERVWPRFCEVMRRYKPTRMTISGLSLGASTGSLLALKTALEARQGAVCGIDDSLWGAGREQHIPLTGLFLSPFPVMRYKSLRTDISMISLDQMLQKLITITAVGYKDKNEEVHVDPIWRMFSDRLSCLGHAVVLPIHFQERADEGIKGNHAWHYDCRSRSWMKNKHVPVGGMGNKFLDLFLKPTAQTSEDSVWDLFNLDGKSHFIGGNMAALHCGVVCVPAMTAYQLQGGEDLEYNSARGSACIWAWTIFYTILVLQRY